MDKFIGINYLLPYLIEMASREHSCRFKDILKLGDKQWGWCYLYNAETSKLDCDKCEYKGLYKKPFKIRDEIIS